MGSHHEANRGRYHSCGCSRPLRWLRYELFEPAHFLASIGDTQHLGVEHPAHANPSSSTPSPTRATPAPTPTTKLVFYRVAYPWAWPGPATAGTAVRQTPKVPPVPELVGISVGQHLVPAGLPYDRMSFTFTNAYPSSHFWYSDTLLAVSTGKVIPKPSYGQPNCAWLGISFMVAQAHTSSGASSIVSQPPIHWRAAHRQLRSGWRR